MKSLQTFFKSAQDKDLPFVVYRKPQEEQIQVWMQQDTTLHYATTYQEEGFIFAPFDSKQQTIIFPQQYATRHTFNTRIESYLPQSIVARESEQERLAHIQLVQKGVAAILAGEMEKVVLSRKRNIPLSNPDSLSALLRLLQAYPNAFVYCWYHPKVGLWLGATPETLLTIKNRQLETMSLAGTQKYEGTEDVLWGEKEQKEQAIVTDAIAQNLNPLLQKSLEIKGPTSVRAGNVLHLKTSLKATLDPSKTSIKDIVYALHPTPAICGLPRLKAQEFIAENEGYTRTFYTGFLGELNLKTIRPRSRSKQNVENTVYKSIQRSTSLYVNLRCMQWEEHSASIYVGGGITSESIPEKEWEETVHKLSTMSSIL